MTAADLSARVAKKKAAPLPDLLAHVEASGNLEKDCEVELSETLKAFKARAAAENNRMMNATDSEHWFAVSFESRDQKEAFLRTMDWLRHGDKFLDGGTLAKQQGIELPASGLAAPRENKKDRLRSLPSIRSL